MSGSGSVIRIRDEQPGSYFLEFFWVKIILKFFNASHGSGIRDEKNLDPRYGIEKIWIRGINIPDSQHCTAY
jgi:hypothetical protein